MEQAKPRPHIAPANTIGTDSAKDATLMQIRDLIYGESKRELDDQFDHMQDRQRDFEDWTRREIRRMGEEAKAAERRADEQRRKLLTDLSATVESMAKNIAKLAEN